MREPIRILSDLHLAHGVSRIERIEQLRPLIAGAGTVIFNGDTWQELSDSWCERSGEMLGELRALCESESADAVFLPGNHDPGWEGAGYVTLAGGRIVVTHGDTFFASGSPWKREIFHAEDEISRLWAECPEAHTDLTARMKLARRLAREFRSMDHPDDRSFFARAWDAAMPPRRAWLMISSWWLRPMAATRFLNRFFPQAEVLIFGHFHLHHCWRHRNRLLIDTGSYLNPGKAHWVEWNDGWLRRGPVIESPEQFTMGEAVNTWRFG